MTRWKKAIVAPIAALTAIVALVATPGVAHAALVPTSCGNATAIRINTPYYPYAYCFSGVGVNYVQLTQVWSIESRNWTVSFLYRKPGGSWTFSSLTSGNTFYVMYGEVNYISVP